MEEGIEVIDKKVSLSHLKKLAKNFVGELVKAVVDVEKGIMAIGGAMHADEEAVLLEHGSQQRNLWGINIHPSEDKLIEFDSMINLRPSQGNRSRSVENPETQERIRKLVERLVTHE